LIFLGYFVILKLNRNNPFKQSYSKEWRNMILNMIIISASLVDILRDPVWQVWGGILISAIIGIAGIIIPIL